MLSCLFHDVAIVTNFITDKMVASWHGFQGFYPYLQKNRNWNLVFAKHRLILISSYHRETVAPKAFR